MAQVAEHPWLAMAQPQLPPLVVNDRLAEVPFLLQQVAGCKIPRDSCDHISLACLICFAIAMPEPGLQADTGFITRYPAHPQAMGRFAAVMMCNAGAAGGAVDVQALLPPVG